MTMQSFVLSLTLFRILAAPFVFISAIFLENYWISFYLFNLAAITDFLDGKLARDFKVESRLGSILDPIGDKLLVLFALIAIIVFTQNIFIAFMSALILTREFWVSALRELNGQDNSKATHVSYTAKIKTTFQFIAIGSYFFGAASNIALITFLAHFFLLAALLLAIKSGFDYSLRTFSD